MKHVHGGPRAGAGRKVKRHHEEYSATVGPLPDDPLKVVGWAQRALALAMKKILEDANLGEVKRRHELRLTARVLSHLVPLERLHQAEQLLRDSAEDQGRDRKDPEMTPVGPGGRVLRLDS